MKVLVHACCAPCSIMPIKLLGKEGHSPSLFFHNPNLHPFLEWQKRREAVGVYSQSAGIALRDTEDYSLDEFLLQVAPYPRRPERCAVCYRMRLRAVAKEAQRSGADAFTTTLLVSPYQEHELIVSEAEKASREYSVPFLYRDFRPHFRRGMEMAKDAGLYRQQYCGCIYSERDRYAPKRPSVEGEKGV